MKKILLGAGLMVGSTLLPMEPLSKKLSEASVKDSEPSVKELVHQLIWDERLDSQDAFGRTPLMRAIQDNNSPLALELLSQGAEVRYVDESKHTALMYATASRIPNDELVRLLIRAHSPLDQQDTEGQTALMFAVQKQHIAQVKELLHAGADSTIQNAVGKTASDMAQETGNKEISRLLHRAGLPANQRNENGWSQLSSAAREGNVENVKRLLLQGAFVNSYMPDLDSSPLIQATGYSRTDKVISLLLDAGASVDYQDHENWTALNHAIFAGKEKVVQILIKVGAKVNHVADDYTVLGQACRQQNLTIIRMLLAAGADPNKKDHEGLTAFDRTKNPSFEQYDYRILTEWPTEDDCVKIPRSTIILGLLKEAAEKIEEMRARRFLFLCCLKYMDPQHPAARLLYTQRTTLVAPYFKTFAATV